jgi:predicted extracellular nuclease
VTVAVRAPARPLILALIAALAMAILPAATVRPVFAAGSISLSTSGETYHQDFDSLAPTGTSSTVPTGWDFAETGTNADTAYTAGTGSSNAGDTYSFGAAGSTERAFGTLRSGSLVSVIGAQLTNSAGTALISLGISYTAEQWRLGQNTVGRAADRFEFQYSIDATSLSTGTWTDVNSLDAASPVVAGTVGALDGNAAANRVTLGATISGLSIPNGASFWIRWVDTDLTPGADDGLGIDGVSITPENEEGDAAPSVVSTIPADGATNVAADTPISITFSEPVTLDPGAATLSCTTATLIPTADPATFEFDYTPPLPDGGTCSYTIDGTKVHDTDSDDPPDTMTPSVSVSFTVVESDPCAGAFTPIPAIQGSGETTPFNGQTKTTEGVVISDDEGPSPTLRGFYLQDPVGDGDPTTSDGIFVFNGNNNDVQNGDNVRVTGTAEEFQGQTQISSPSIVDCDNGDTVTPTDIYFPATLPTSLEAYEGMLVRVPDALTVTEHFQLGRFGQVLLSSGGKLDSPTAVVPPGAAAVALQAQNNLRKIILDDSSQGQNPDPIVFARGGQPLSASNTLRGGDTVTNLTGVMTYTWAGNAASGNAYRIRPLNAIDGSALFVAVNQRPGTPVAVDGNVRVVGMNLLNYFNTFDGLPDTVDNCRNGVGGPLTDCRGADTQAEFDRQWPKTVQAILGVDADVIGINEVENDGYGPDSAIAHLVDQLNAASDDEYAFIDVDAKTGQVNAAGTDAIKVGLLYRTAAVTPIGTTGALNSAAFVNGGDAAPRSRPSIAQAFETVDGARFVVDVNHFKSKGSACTLPDQGDGQGNCNVVRRNAAIALRDWLASDPTGIDDDDVLIVGDLNSYAKEDPVTVLTDAGYTNLVREFVEGTPYSYLFDGQWGYLDYALGSPSALGQVAGVVEWHINSDEPSVLDYNLDFKTPNLQSSLYAPDRFRVSDHDPIVVGLDADSDRPVVDAGGPYTVEEADTTQLTATGSDPTGDDVTYDWDLDGNGTFETPGASVTFSAGSRQAPQTVTVTVMITDEHGQFSTDTADIDVIWDFGGFKAPINDPGVTTVNAGGSQPVKFSLDGPQGSAILDGAPTLQHEDCLTHEAIGSPINASANEPLAYDAATDTYKYSWKTQKAWAGWCGTFSLHLADGQSYDFEVRFKS